MAGLFDDFKDHAESLHKDIKRLEYYFRNPLGFYGTTVRSDSASIILKETVESVNIMNDGVQEYMKDTEEMIFDNKQLLTEVDKVEEELGNMTKILEKQGFVFSSENNDIDRAEANENVEEHPVATIYENVKNVDPEKNDNIVELSENVSNVSHDKEIENEDCSMKMSEETEKYMELNNIDVYDIVTPYIQRQSMKKT